MQTETIQPETYWCRKCESEAMTANPNCQKCGNKMQTQSQIKSLGKVIIILGIVIALGSGLGVVVIIAVLFFAKLPENEVVTAFVALAACGASTSAGIAAIFGGLWQAKHGRTSKVFIWIFFGIIFVILMLGSLFSIVKG